MRVRNYGLCRVKNDKILVFGIHRGRNIATEYDVIKNKWNKSVYFDKCIMGRVATCIVKGEYVLIFCSSNDIYIYSMTHKTLRKSQIKSVMRPYQAITVNEKKKDELVTFGFVRSRWGECGINDHLFPPQYLIHLMGKYHHSEYVHLFGTGLDDSKVVHHKINAFDIIR